MSEMHTHTAHRQHRHPILRTYQIDLAYSYFNFKGNYAYTGAGSLYSAAAAHMMVRVERIRGEVRHADLLHYDQTKYKLKYLCHNSFVFFSYRVSVCLNK